MGKPISRQVDEKIELVEEWCRLVVREDKIAQVAQFSKVGAGRGNKGGESEAARQLGLDRDDVRRAAKVASITPEAQQAAHEVGLADNRSALLEAASKPAEEQATYLRERAAKKEMKLAPDMLDDFEAEEKQYAAIVAAWNRAGQAARQEVRPWPAYSPARSSAAGRPAQAHAAC